MEEELFGYEQERFPHLKGEEFLCKICICVVRNPEVNNKQTLSFSEWFNVNHLNRNVEDVEHYFVDRAYTHGYKKRTECPNRCGAGKERIGKIKSMLLIRMYNDLDIQCIHESCKKLVKLGDIEKHEQQCNKPKCLNFSICDKNQVDELKEYKVCSLNCLLLNKIKQSQANPKEQLNVIKRFLEEFYPQQQQIAQEPVQQLQQQQDIKWSLTHKGTNIEVSNDGKKVWLKEAAYMFRSIIVNTPFYGGKHYWEIIADERTENELKIGISTKIDFNYNSAFCDFEYGYCFYGLGQLRHNSNASGPQYGKRFKKEGVLGCFLNMEKGQLSFALNGEFMGIAFSHDNLKKGPIVIGVSLLHCAGCILDSSKPVPNYFPQ